MEAIMHKKIIGDDDISIKKSEPIFVQPEKKDHSGFYYLSNLDQILTVFIETVYLYKPTEDQKWKIEKVVDPIKQALAKVLVHYYPLAGKLRKGSNGNYVVECTNDGVLFVEAVADCDMDVFDVQVPNVRAAKLVHSTPAPHPSDLFELPLLKTQVTRFKCGGWALGVSINHCMVDGVSGMAFVNSWAETVRGVPLTNMPFLDRSIIRPRQPPKVNFPFGNFTEEGMIIADTPEKRDFIFKSFSFDLEKLTILKKEAMGDGELRCCSGFTVLAAFVWRTRIKALKLNPGIQTKLQFMVDVRSKLNPPLPREYFGNGTVVTGCVYTVEELLGKPFSFVVQKVQNAIQVVTDEYIKSWIDLFEVTRSIRPSFGLATLAVSSWTRLDYQNTDFGYGGPISFGCVTTPGIELCVFLPDDKNKKGIKLIQGLPVAAMNTFEKMLQVHFP